MLAEDVSADELDSAVRAELLPLARPVAETVARHLVMTGRLLDDEPSKALEHAIAARRLASRIGAVREAVGLAAYHAQEWSVAIAELRTYHRMTGRQTHLAVVADCERALGRPEKAIDLFRSAEREKLGRTESLELLIVAAGARGDMGQHDAAAAMLQIRELSVDSEEPWAARLRYAYADSLLKSGRTDEAREWFGKAAEVDAEGITDAAERLLEMDGIEISGEHDEDEGAEPAESADESDESDESDVDVDEDDADADYEDEDYDEDDEDYDGDESDEDDDRAGDDLSDDESESDDDHKDRGGREGDESDVDEDGEGDKGKDTPGAAA